MSHEDRDRVRFRQRPPVQRAWIQPPDLLAKLLVQLMEERAQRSDGGVAHRLDLFRDAVLEIASKQ